MFAVFKPRHAVIAAFLGAWLFLPLAGYDLPGLTSYTKITATSVPVLLAVVLFDAGRLTGFRPGWFDIPMAIWCVVPMASSVTNGLGAYDGGSATVTQTVQWGLPYLIGRLYFSDLDGLRDLAIGIFIGGLIYVPLCLLEVRMSPRLHIWVYGFHQHSWRQSHRFGGWRPTVFMQHGLMVAMWMVLTTVVGYWLWRTKAVLSLQKVPMSLLVPGMAVTAVLCKSAGAVILGLVGIAALSGTRMTKMKWGLAALTLAPVLYMGVRGPGVWDGSHLIETVEIVPILEERVHSFRYRLDAEDILADHALRRPVFGWGGWGRHRPADMGADVDDVATDGFWVIALGTRGIVGLTAVTIVILLPAALFLWKLPVAAWWHPTTAPAAALTMVLLLFMADSLFNAMINPIFILAAGGLAGWLAPLPAMRGRRKAAAAYQRQVGKPSGAALGYGR